jgi:peptidyl-prolyl cis-trans isomerase D
MLIQAFRDNIPKWVTAVILALLIIPFALWGINSYFTASSDSSVATVDGTPIAPADFQRAYQGQYTQLQRYYGANFRPEMIDEKQLRQEVLDRLIEQTLVDQQVAAGHYAVGDARLAELNLKNPAFQIAGKFSMEAYTAALGQYGLSPAGYESQMRQQIVAGELEDSIRTSAAVTPAELAQAIAVRDQQREVGYLTVSAKRFLPGIQVTDADVQAYYQAHPTDFMAPEKVTLAYVELDGAQLAKAVQPDEATLQALYQQQLETLKQDETRVARHILVTVNSADPKLDAAAKAKAEDLLKQIKTGADFAKLAQQYSDDIVSAKKGGELGTIQRGVTDKPFEDALFGAQKEGDIVGPVRSKFGYHIIQLEKIQAAPVKSFADMRPQLLADYQKKQADDKYFALGDQLADLAYEHRDSLDEVSKQLSLPVQTVADVTRDGGEGIGANPEVRKAAFSDAVLTQGFNSEPIQIGPNHSVVVRVKGHVPSEPRRLADVHSQILSLLQQQRASAAAAKLTASLLDALQKGGDAAALAKANGAVFTAPALITRNQKGLPLPLLAAAFTAPQPAAGARSLSQVSLDGGDQAVLWVAAVKPGAASALSPEQAAAEKAELSRLDGTTEYAAYLAYLRQQAKVVINTKNIDQSDQ